MNNNNLNYLMLNEYNNLSPISKEKEKKIRLINIPLVESPISIAINNEENNKIVKESTKTLPPREITKEITKEIIKVINTNQNNTTPNAVTNEYKVEKSNNFLLNNQNKSLISEINKLKSNNELLNNKVNKLISIIKSLTSNDMHDNYIIKLINQIDNILTCENILHNLTIIHFIIDKNIDIINKPKISEVLKKKIKLLDSKIINYEIQCLIDTILLLLNEKEKCYDILNHNILFGFHNKK